MTSTPRERQASPRAARPAQRPHETPGRPAQDRSRQARPALSPEERQRREAARREAMERAREEKNRQKALRRFRRRRLFILSALFALLIVAGYYVILFAGLGKAETPKDAYPVQIFRAGEKNAVKTFTVEETLYNGSAYLPLTVLQDLVTVTQYGDHARRSLAFSGGDVATFTLGTPNCEINGVGMSLEAPVFLKDDVIYLPVDFFYRRMNCFEYTFSSPLNANVLTFLPEVPPGLVAHVMTSSPRIDPATVPAAPATQNT